MMREKNKDQYGYKIGDIQRKINQKKTQYNLLKQKTEIKNLFKGAEIQHQHFSTAQITSQCFY